MLNPNTDLEERVHEAFAEIVANHQRWFNGAVPNTLADFARTVAGIDPGLSYVFPSGGRSSEGEFLETLQAAWGQNPEFRLHTPRSFTRLLWHSGNGVVAEAVELQDGARAVKPPRHARRSTLLFLFEERAPHGLALRHLHESIVPPDEEHHFDWSVFDGPAVSPGSG